jgi:hypothetical protein
MFSSIEGKNPLLLDSSSNRLIIEALYLLSLLILSVKCCDVGDTRDAVTEDAE